MGFITRDWPRSVSGFKVLVSLNSLAALEKRPSNPTYLALESLPSLYYFDMNPPKRPMER